MKALRTTMVVCLTLAALCMTALADENYTSCMTIIQEQMEVQEQAHRTAQLLREQGYEENCAYIQAAKSIWQDAAEEIVAYQNLSRYSDEDLRILTTTVYYEAGTTTEELREYVAQVVLNRQADRRFPNSIKDIINQPGQYNTRYTTTSAAQSIKDKDAANGTYNYAVCQNSAKLAMMGRVNMPSSVIYQANFTQGTGVWKTVYFNSGWFSSTSYFCYG